MNLRHSALTLRPLAVAMLLVAVAGAVLAWGAERLPLLDTLVFGFDWHNYWLALRAGWPDYRAADIFNPPWTLLLLAPLGVLSFKSSWAILTLATLLVLIVTAPRRPDGRPSPWILAAVLFSFWTLRQLADGNLAALMVGGFALLLAGWRDQSPWRLAAGVLLVTAKLQESWLALLVLAGFAIKTWPPRRLALAAGGVAAVVVPAMLVLGGDWLGRLLPASGPGGPQLAPSVARLITNISLTALAAWGVPAWARAGLGLAVVAASVFLAYRRRWEFSHELAGCLIAAGLLASPYTNGASLVTVLAVGVAPLTRDHPRAGWPLLALSFLPYLTLVPNTASGWPETWQMGFIVAIWIVLAWHLLRAPRTATEGAS